MACDLLCAKIEFLNMYDREDLDEKPYYFMGCDADCDKKFGLIKYNGLKIYNYY